MYGSLYIQFMKISVYGRYLNIPESVKDMTEPREVRCKLVWNSTGQWGTAQTGWLLHNLVKVQCVYANNCSTRWYDTTRCCTMQHGIVRYNPLLYDATWCCTTQPAVLRCNQERRMYDTTGSVMINPTKYNSTSWGTKTTRLYGVIRAGAGKVRQDTAWWGTVETGEERNSLECAEIADVWYNFVRVPPAEIPFNTALATSRRVLSNPSTIMLVVVV